MAAIYGFQVCSSYVKNRLHPDGFYTVDNNNTDECYNKLPNIDNTHNKAACVIGFQRLCFSFPITIVPIATVVVLEVLMFYPDILRLGDCDLYFAQWNLGEMEDINDSWPLLVAGLALYLSLVYATHHIWTSNGIILGKTQR
jgi:hypothetical protein